MEYVIAVILGIIFTEVLGYTVHRMLHSQHQKIAWLTELHLVHHQQIYPPTKLRSTKYIAPPNGKFLGMGVEWILPVSLVTAPVITIALALGMPFWTVATFLVSALTWTAFMISYMHDAFHIKRSWLLRSRWFKRIRKLHDLHHLDMTSNFGICFFSLDKLFKTYRKKWNVASKELTVG